MAPRKRKTRASSPPSDAEYRTPSRSGISQVAEDGYVRRSNRKTTDVLYEEDTKDDHPGPDAPDYGYTVNASSYGNNRRGEKKKMNTKMKQEKRTRRAMNVRESVQAGIARGSHNATSATSPTPAPYTRVENHHGASDHGYDASRGFWAVAVSASDIEAMDVRPEATFDASGGEMSHVLDKPSEKSGEEPALRKG